MATAVPLETAYRRSSRSNFFVYTAVLMLIVVALGFGKSFYLRSTFSSSKLPVYLVVHGLVMTAWFVFYLIQAGLVTSRRTALHRRLGIAGVALAAAVVVTGVVVNLNLIARARSRGLLEGEEGLRLGAAFALSSIAGLVLFAIVIALAVVLRKRPAGHKRLMFWASVLLLGPALSNTRPLGQFLDSLVAPTLPFFPADFLWFFALMAYDWATIRRFHPATWISFIVLAVSLILMNGVAQGAPLQEWFLSFVRLD